MPANGSSVSLARRSAHVAAEVYVRSGLGFLAPITVVYEAPIVKLLQWKNRRSQLELNAWTEIYVLD